MGDVEENEVIEQVQREEEQIKKKQEETLNNKKFDFILRTKKWTELERERRQLRSFLSEYRGFS